MQHHPRLVFLTLLAVLQVVVAPRVMATDSGVSDAATDIARAETDANACLENDFDALCAVRVFEDALARHPDSGRLRADLYAAYLSLGTYWEEREEIDLARGAYDKALALGPTLITALGLWSAEQSLALLAPYDRILEGDGFRSHDRQFATGASNAGTTSYRDDALVWRWTPEAPSGVYVPPRVGPRTDVAISIVVDVVTSGDGRASLWVGRQPDGSGFTLDYRRDISSWRFSYIAGETWQEVIPWTLLTDQESLTRLEIRVKDDRIRIVIDGIVVGSVSDPRYQAGLVAFGGGLFTFSESDEFVVTFDDLRVYVPK